MLEKEVLSIIAEITAVVMTAVSGQSAQIPEKAETPPAAVAVQKPTEEKPAANAVSEVMKQYNDAKKKTDNTFKQISAQKDKPIVHIFTENGKDILSKETYNSSVIDVINCGKSYRLTAEGGVKVRGNSSAQSNEKPYRIKFTEPQNMLGLHDGREYKSWVLLKSNWNLVSDYMALNLAEEIFRGKYYSSDCTFVNVYVNGSYKGLYLLCEQNQAAEDRVDIYEPKKGDKRTAVGYLLEIDHYAGEDPSEPYFTLDYDKISLTDIAGTTRKVVADSYTIKSDTRSDKQRKFIEKYTDGVFKILYEAIENDNLLMFDKDYNVVSAKGVYSTPKQACEAVIDLDAAVNMLILEELVHNFDVGEGSFFMAVDFSKNSKYERLTFLAPWDFNWSYEGSPKGKYYGGAFQEPTYDGADRSNIWLTLLMKADFFQDMVKDKWALLQKNRSLDKVVTKVCEEIDSLENDVGSEKWKLDAAENIAKFVDGRITWLDSQWGG